MWLLAWMQKATLPRLGANRCGVNYRCRETSEVPVQHGEDVGVAAGAALCGRERSFELEAERRLQLNFSICRRAGEGAAGESDRLSEIG